MQDPAWLPQALLPLGLTYKGLINGNKGSIFYGHIIVPTNYDIKISGKTHVNNKVNLKITTTAKIQSDSNGGFKYKYKTTGLPSGEYSVEISGKEKEIKLKSSSTSIQTSTITSIESSSGVSTSTQGTSGKIQTNGISSEETQISDTTPLSNEESVTSQATPEMTTASEETVADKPVTSSTPPEQKSILQSILDLLKFW